MTFVFSQSEAFHLPDLAIPALCDVSALIASHSQLIGQLMFLILTDILYKDELSRVLQRLEKLDWKDGARTAGGRARAVKRNEQADLRSKSGQGLHEFLLDAIQRSSVLQAAARPKNWSRLLVSRTQDNGGYGDHVDNALMNGLRTDLSFTLFLSEPDSYDGGDLVIDLPGGQQSVKLSAGDMVLYPSGAIHRVEPVTRGSRLAVVGWIESQVRRADEREILFDLDNTRISLAKSLDASAPELLMLDKIASNLLRRWAE